MTFQTPGSTEHYKKPLVKRMKLTSEQRNTIEFSYFYSILAVAGHIIYGVIKQRDEK